MADELDQHDPDKDRPVEQPEEPRDEEREEDAYLLNPQAVARIIQAVDLGDQQLLWDEMEPLHAADIADLLEQISAFDRRRLVELYGEEFDGDLLTELDDSIREEVIGILHPEVLAEAVRELDSDDVVDLVEDLEDDQQNAILEVLEDSDRLAVRQSLTYPEYSAGRLMQREVVMAPEHTGTSAKPSTTCAIRTICPNSSTTSSWSTPGCGPSAT